MQHIFSISVENKSGVLAHISGMFAARGYNIDSLTVAETEDPGVSHMTIVTHGDDAIIEQIRKQLSKIIDVIKVNDISTVNHVERDLMLVRVKANGDTRTDLLQLGEAFEGAVVDIGMKHLTFEITGPEEKLYAFIELLRPYGIEEASRTGRIAMARGAK
jgi:acetolactate synthase-1/3 small subunit